jgi:Tfp pilus assembly protein PilX
MSNNTKLLCLFLRAQKINKSSEQGYAMAMVSMVSIIMLSLLAASMTFSNLAKTRTDAFVDSHSAFSVAEAGLNKRAADLQAKLETYSGVSGTSPTSLFDCYGKAIPTGRMVSAVSETDDFECRNYRFESSSNISKVASGGDIALNSGEQDKNIYVAYTSVANKTVIAPDSQSPASTKIPATEPFGGLNAAEYKYVVQSTAKKPVDSESVSLPNYTVDEIAALGRQQRAETQSPGDDILIQSVETKKNRSAAGKSSNNTSLSMAFTTRVVPLFQFAVFYNGDIEFNSTSKMRVKGWVHSNANIYVQPAGVINEESDSTTDFLNKVSAAGKIYNRVDAWDKGIDRTGITRVLLTGQTGDCDTVGNCQLIPDYSAGVTDALTAGQISAFTGREVQDGHAGTLVLKTPSPGFTRKRNYFDNKIGIYYSKADMRLEMVPDRDLGTNGKTVTPWDRNKAIIPFNFTSVTTTGTDTCSTALPTAGADPAANYIDPTREKVSTLRCNKFTKGQLQSLRQPVLVMTKKFHSTNIALQPIERTILGGPAVPETPPVMIGASPIDLTTLSDSTKDKILRALQVALVSTPEPVTFDLLNRPFAHPSYGDSSNSDGDDTNVCNTDPDPNLACNANLNSFKTEFKRLVKKIFPTSLTDDTNTRIRNTLFAASPSKIAALRDAWFLPAPIQRVETTNAATTDNLRSSGFYDSREQRWITMLQTNIASLSVWNRDGLYVASDDETLTTAYAASIAKRDLAFGDTTTATYSTSGLAFDRSAVNASKTTLISTTSGVLTTVANFKSLGLGGTDTTEGGLVFHASVSDDLNGDGVMDSNDVTIDKTTAAKRVLKKKPDGTNETDERTGAVIVTDYYRNYPNQADIKQSPFSFAFNGGNYLPNGLILSSDQSVYVQGNFNNNAHNGTTNLPDSTANTPSDDRLPASIVADTITALSNQCVIDTVNNGVPGSQLSCGFRRAGAAPLAAAARPMAINAAFLSNTDTSSGNYHTTGETLPAVADRRYSGGVNNYIRLLEDWGNKYALNYMGSMISLGAPLEYSGQYISGGGNLATRTDNPYYNIPFRNFNYDDKFNKNENVPPLTPKASYVKQSSFSRTY